MTKKKEIPIEPGTCPKCGCKELNYSAVIPKGSAMCYPFQCTNKKCGFSGQEWYSCYFIDMTDSTGITV